MQINWLNSGSAPIWLRVRIISSVPKPCIVPMLLRRYNMITAIIDAVCIAHGQLIMTSLTKQFTTEQILAIIKLHRHGITNMYFTITLTYWPQPSAPLYTLGKKGCYTPIEDNKTNVDRTFVFPLGWNWHDMDPWLFPNEIRHYLGQTFNARSSGIVKLRNHSVGGRSPKSIFTLWQLWINICIFFQKFSDCSNNAPSNPYGY